MRALLQIVLCTLLAGGAMAQHRGGGGVGGGGFRGGSVGGGFRGGSIGGGFRGGYGYGGLYGGYYNRGYYGYGFYGGYWPYGYGWAYPWWGVGYWPYSYYDSYPYYDYGYAGYNYPAYQASPNVTVVYPNQAQPPATNVYVDRANPVMQEYDQYGQEIHRAGSEPGGSGSAAAASPIYLIAFQDHTIRAAGSYWVDGRTLHYVTLQHEERLAPLDTVDRGLSMQLNRERRVQFILPAQ